VIRTVVGGRLSLAGPLRTPGFEARGVGSVIDRTRRFSPQCKGSKGFPPGGCGVGELGMPDEGISIAGGLVGQLELGGTS